MVLEAGYSSTTGFRKVVKATILVKKKPGMSDADFIDHYNHKHAQMAAPVLQKHNVITYSLIRYDPASKALTPDHENFMMEDEMRMMVGDEYMVIEDGVKVG
ncbi:hypothetical protein B0A48_00443 [Cryoendolithus antarcticus]|uniref:EthD domain-containing protein n=1 Tax=Cryoendolithus antarcticus TaxID=1507870 RepID=A0A1V8TUV4_9PEZI|nr:hypothetical protein B0A48_00443 [Cryoendolithus antarcticus]